MINLYPPMIGAGVRVDLVADDWRRVEVRLPLTWRNRNYVGTHFGGNMFTMVDPFYMIMLINILGSDYLVWDQRACIDFKKPGKGTLRATFQLDDETLRKFEEGTRGGAKFLHDLAVDIVDEEGDVVARVVKTIYARRKRAKDAG